MPSMNNQKKTIKDIFTQNRFFTIFLLSWILLFCSLRTIQHFSFGTNAFDLSIPDYMMFYTLNGELMHEPFHGYWGNHFAHHFTPILFFITPLYFVLNGPLFLLYIQVLSGALSALILYLIAKHMFPEKYIPIVISVTYLIYRPFLSGIMYDFHYEMFFPFFLFMSYYFVAVRRSYMYYFLSITFALLIKEDVALFVFFFGVFLFFKLKKNRKIGLITSAYAFLYFMMTMEVLIPYFRNQAGLQGQYEYYILWKDFGSSAFEILKTTISRPQLVFHAIPWLKVMPHLFNIVGPLLFIPFFSTFILLIIPPILILATSRSPIMQGFGLHYIANILPFLFLSLTYGLKHIKKLLSQSKRSQQIILVVVISLLFVNVANTKWELFKISRYSAIKDYSTMKTFIRNIPEDASVATLSSLIPHIPKRKQIYMLPNTDNAEYILIHSGINLWPFDRMEFTDFLDKVSSPQSDYECIKEEGPIRLFKKRGER